MLAIRADIALPRRKAQNRGILPNTKICNQEKHVNVK